MFHIYIYKRQISVDEITNGIKESEKVNMYNDPFPFTYIYTQSQSDTKYWNIIPLSHPLHIL